MPVLKPRDERRESKVAFDKKKNNCLIQAPDHSGAWSWSLTDFPVTRANLLSFAWLPVKVPCSIHMSTLLMSGAHVCVQHPLLHYHNLQGYIISFFQSSHNFHHYGNSKLIPHRAKCQEVALLLISFVFAEVLFATKWKDLPSIMLLRQ